MLKRWFPVSGALALALLLTSAGTSRAQFFFFPFMGPVGAMSPWSGTGGWGMYPGTFGINNYPRWYGANYANSTAPSMMWNQPSYGYGTNMGAAYGGGLRSYYGNLMTTPFNYAASPGLYGYPSSNAVTPVSYVAYSPPLYTYRGPAVAPAAAVLPPSDQPATVEITAPADAEIWVDGQRTSQSGTYRVFTTPELEKGKSYHYEVRARWTDGGRVVDRTRKVPVYAGGRSNVDFTDEKP
jgi:uncharacterized protein (TIGR03000 family)